MRRCLVWYSVAELLDEFDMVVMFPRSMMTDARERISTRGSCPFRTGEGLPDPVTMRLLQSLSQSHEWLDISPRANHHEEDIEVRDSQLAVDRTIVRLRQGGCDEGSEFVGGQLRQILLTHLK